MNVWSGAERMGAMSVWWMPGIALMVALVWIIARSATRDDEGNGPSAEEILKHRYASGELDRDEYLRRLEDVRR